jgi:hypothetical protein
LQKMKVIGDLDKSSFIKISGWQKP